MYLCLNHCYLPKHCFAHKAAYSRLSSFILVLVLSVTSHSPSISPVSLNVDPKYIPNLPFSFIAHITTSASYSQQLHNCFPCSIIYSLSLYLPERSANVTFPVSSGFPSHLDSSTAAFSTTPRPWVSLPW